MFRNIDIKKIDINKVLIVLGIFIFIIINVPYTTLEPYTDTEYYTEKEPYTVIEYYNYSTTEPYIEEVSIDYIVEDAQYMNYFPPPSYLWVTIKNVDTKSGYFDVYFYITNEGGGFPTITKISESEYISAGETKTVKVRFNDIISKFTYNVTSPTKEVTKTRNMTKQTIVTKYREVQKYREVIKLKEVTSSSLQRIYEKY